MKWIILLLLIGGVLYFGYPIANEDGAGECDALERRAIRVSSDSAAGQMVGQFVHRLSGGQLANMAVKKQYPNTPVAIACAMLYWRSFYDPNGFQNFAKSAGQ
jgi:hypothetical protein